MNNKFLYLLIVVVLVLTASGTAYAAPQAICTSGGSGNWTTITWSGCAGTPQPGDDVVIATGTTVTLDTSATIASLIVNGTLTFGNGADRTLTVSGAITVNSSGRINVGTTGTGTHTLNVGGDFTNAGIFAGRGSNSQRVINTTFNRAGLQTISGNGTTGFNSLTINSGSRVVFPATFAPTVEVAMTVNTGGAVQQTLAVNSGIVPFLQIANTAGTTVQYRGVELTPSANALGSTTVVITTTVNGGCTAAGTSSPVYATRCYSITPTNNAAATVRLYALTATQLNGILPANLFVYRNASGWQQLTTNASTGSASGGYSYAQADTPGFSAFLLGGPTTPTSVTISSLKVQPQSAPWLIPIGLALAIGAVLLLVRRRAR